MSEPRIVTHLDIRKLDDGEIVRSVTLNPPQKEDTHRLAEITRGLLRNLRDDCFIDERYAK